MIKVDFIAPPYSGHLNPLVELARPLREKGYAVRFITGPRKISLLKHLGFQAVPILPQDAEAMERIANTAHPVQNNPRLLLRQLRQNLKILPRIKDDIRTLLKDNKTDMVVADFVAVPAGIVCQEEQIPWITTIPTPFALETREGTPSYMGGWAHSKTFRSRARDTFGRAVIRVFKRGVEYLCREELKGLNFKVYGPQGQENAYSPYSILGLGMKEFEFPRDWPRQFKFIGPCCNSPEQLQALALPQGEHEKKVLVTLGTHLEWAKSKLLEQLTLLAQDFKDVLFIVSLGRPEFAGKPPGSLQGNIITYEYIPYNPYLTHFDAIIHHGGAGVTYNGIKFLKPSLVIPHDYDQFDFAARIDAHRIGVRCKHIGSSQAKHGLTRILNGDYSEGLKKMNQYYQNCNPARELENEILRLLDGSKRNTEKTCRAVS